MIGATLGSYRITRRLSAGGMGEVYVAEHVMIGRKAAIKLLLPQVSQNPELVERFFNEAKATAAIGHPGIVDIFDFGRHDDGRAFLIMEFLEGEPLNKRIKRQGKVPLEHAIAILEHMTSALGAAHQKGIVHRDLKPDNVFLVPDPGVKFGERAKLLDFGIAKLNDERPGAVKTRTGMVMGTPAYMAPEQCRGAGEVDHRADLYAVGCIFFALLCGRPPFVGMGAGEIIGLQQFMAPPRPSELDPTVDPRAEALIMWLLQKNPAARVQNTEQLAAELALLGEALASGRPSTAGPHAPLNEAATLATPEPYQRAATPAPIASQQNAVTPAPYGRAATPTPISQQFAATPEPSTPTPVPAQPTTLHSAAAERMRGGESGEKSRRWIPISIAAIVVAAAGVLVLAMSSGEDGAPSASSPGLDAALADGMGIATLVPADTGGAAEVATVGGEVATAGEMKPVGEVKPAGDVENAGSDVELAGDDGDGEQVQDPDEVAMVKLTIESTPPGAAVRLSGSREVLGKTPYVHETRRGDDPLTFIVTLSGYQRKRITLSADNDDSKHLHLEKRPTGKPRKKPNNKPPDTKDPFGGYY